MYLTLLYISRKLARSRRHREGVCLFGCVHIKLSTHQKLVLSTILQCLFSSLCGHEVCFFSIQQSNIRELQEHYITVDC